MRAYIKRLVRVLLVLIAAPVVVVFPLTGALVAFVALYVLVVAPLFVLGYWAFNTGELEHELESWREAAVEIPAAFLYWVWYGDD